MRISEFIDPKGIKLHVELADQNDAIDKLIALHNEVGNLKDVAKFKEAILSKPEQHDVLSYESRSHAERNMNQIGG